MCGISEPWFVLNQWMGLSKLACFCSGIYTLEIDSLKTVVD